ncbi:MAG: thiamine phosphate synthase [Pirellulaceae bacterium]|nr:thiamine phosphate synthase [Pirellulaceae bacterium]
MAAGRQAVWRIIDANANRASEGLRVAEEYARFVLDDAHLTGWCKQLRHDLQTVLAPWSAELLLARDTMGDVGTRLTTAQEYQRSTLRDVAQANLNRVEQSLRCLEEYAKLLQAERAAQLESLRYRVYTLAQMLHATDRGLTRLQATRLYVLLDGGSDQESFERLLAAILPSVDMIQLRDKRLDDRQLLERARAARSLTQAAGVLLVLNDRPDLALLAAADGVHLGQEDLPVRDVRRLVGTDLLLGVSTHTMQQARQAVVDGADYLGCGPTFPSRTKRFDQFPGLEFLRSVHLEIRLPAFAIGGVEPDNVPQVLAAGLPRVAVSGCVQRAPDPASVARHLRQLLS